jgi:enamine deaminase RidA (YjgF/YER057c/UK114 family)
MSDPAKRLKELGIALPKPAAPVANYVGFVRSGNLLFVSGQLPFRDGKVMAPGHLGGNVTVEEGRDAARQCAINILAQVNSALSGDLTKVTRIVKLTGFVSCTPDFADHPKVINGASDLFADVFGERGRHARAAVGVSALPLAASVEVEAIIEVE